MDCEQGIDRFDLQFSSVGAAFRNSGQFATVFARCLRGSSTPACSGRWRGCGVCGLSGVIRLVERHRPSDDKRVKDLACCLDLTAQRARISSGAVVLFRVAGAARVRSEGGKGRPAGTQLSCDPGHGRNQRKQAAAGTARNSRQWAPVKAPYGSWRTRGDRETLAGA